MFEKFGREKTEQEEARETILTSIFKVEIEQNKSLDELIQSGNLIKADQRITEENFPNSEQNQSFNAKIKGADRDSSLEDMNYDLDKEGLRSATVYELLEFLPQCPEIVEQLYALGSILEEENNRKLCVKISKKGSQYSLSLEQLGHGITREGKMYYYTPWPATFLTIQKS